MGSSDHNRASEAEIIEVDDAEEVDLVNDLQQQFQRNADFKPDNAQVYFGMQKGAKRKVVSTKREVTYLIRQRKYRHVITFYDIHAAEG